jgi:DNA-binding CsgD family transcriptional regulator
MGLEAAIDIESFARLYDLTRTEVGLAIRLTHGESIDGAAAALHLSPHAARMHLKRFFRKTEARGHAELASTLSAAS